MAIPTLLLIEDAPENDSPTRQAVKKSGLPYALKAVSNDKQAMDYLSGKGDYADRGEHPMPLAILIDWPLPGRGEAQLLDWLRRQPELKDVPVIAILSLEGTAELQEAYTLGATTHLAKPIEPDSLRTIIKTFARPEEQAVRILLLDEDEEARGQVKNELERAFPDITIEAIKRSEDYHKALEQGDVGMVITEAQLSWTDGLSVLKEVKSLFQDCPVIMYASGSHEEIAAEAIQNGLEQYVLKSSPRSTWLIGAVRQALRHTRDRQAVRDADARFRESCDNLPMGVFKATPEGQIIESNAAFRKILGEGDQPGRPGFGQLAAGLAGLKTRERPQNESDEAEGLLHFEMQLGRTPKEAAWVEVKARLCHNSAGAPMCYQGTLEDISMRKQAELALKEAHEQAKSTLEAVPDMLFELDGEGRIYSGHTPLKAPLYAEPEEFIGKTVSQVLPKEAAEVCLKALENAAKYGSDSSGATYALDMPDGRRWFELAIAAKKMQPSLTPRYVATVRDITASIKAEEALRESEHKLRTIIEQMSEGFVLLAEDGSVREWNQAIAALTGITPEEAIGKDYWDIQERIMLPEQRTPENLARVKRMILAALKGRSVRPLAASFEAVIQRADEQPIVIQQNNFPLYLGDKFYLGSVATDITKYRLAEQKNALLATVVSSHDVAIISTDLDGTVTSWNEGARRLYGYTEAETIGRHISLLVAPEQREQLQALRQSANDGQSIRQLETTRRKKTGEDVPVSLTISPIKDSQGKIIGTSSMSLDITKRKSAEKALRESEARLRTLIADAPVAISMSRNGIVMYNNAAVSKMYGFDSIEESYGRSVLDYFASQCHEQLKMNIARREKGLPAPAEYETIGRRRDGDEFPLQLAVSRVELEDGPATLAFLTDITERKRGEKALRESEARFRTLMTHAPIAISMMRNNITLYINEAFAKVFGLANTEEGLDRPALDFIAPQSHAQIIENLKRWDNDPAAPTEYETFGRRKDGTEFLLHIDGARVLLEDGMVNLGFFTDVTERKQAEEALLKSEERFRMLITNAPVAISMLRNGIRVYSNPAHNRMFGHANAEETYGKSALELVAPHCREQVAENMRKRVKGLPAPDSYETVGLRVDGTEFPIILAVVQMELEEGPATIGIITDITEQKQAEKALRESETRFRTLIANAPSAVCLTRNGNILYNNTAFLNLFGLEENEDIVGQSILEHIAPASRDKILEYTRSREQGLPAPNEYEVNALRKDGTEFTLQLAITQVPLADGPATLAFLSDITERKRAEEAIRDSEERYRQLFEAERDAILLIDNEKTQIIEANTAAETLLGYTHQELLQMKMIDISAEPTATRQAIAMNVERVPIRWYRKKDGSTFPVEIVANYFVYRNRKVHLADLRDISQRLEAETAIRESEWKFRQYIEQSTEGIVLIDNEGNVSGWNRAQEKITGVAREEALGEPIWEVVNRVVSPDLQTASVRDNFKSAIMEGIKTGQCRLFESPREYTILRNPDKEELYVQGLFFPIKKEKGYLIGSVTRDISVEKAAQETIKRRNRELAMFNEIIASTAGETKPEVILQIACRELAQTLALPHAFAFLLNENLSAATVVAEHRETTHSRMEGQIIDFAESTAKNYLLTLRKPLLMTANANNPLWNELCAQFSRRIANATLLFPLLINDIVTGGILLEADEPDHFTPEDMSLAGKAVDEVTGALARARLAQVQYRLVTAMEQAQEVVIVTDPEGIILYTNPAFERISGYSATEASGKTPNIIKSGQHDPAFYEELWKTIKAGHVWQGRFENQRKDGSLYTQESSITPVRNESGEIINFVEVARDVTRELELERQYLHSQKMEAIGQLTAGIAHDFNNLLTAINGFAELMHMELPAGHPSQESAERILYSGRRASDLVRQLLAFSHKQIIVPQTVSLNEIVINIDKMLRRIIGEHIELKTHLADEPWLVKMDPAQIEQVIVNLAVNARDAMPGGGHLSIGTTNIVLDETYGLSHLDIKAGPYVQLAVTDDGVGMSENVKAHIFEPFFTTKGLGKGTGLGLATVYGIIKQAGGHIRVTSEEGQGTTFKIYLPRAEEKIAGETAKETEVMPAGTESILLVEDDEGVRDIVRLVLEQQGYHVIVAADGQEALQIVTGGEERIDLLLSDIVMRGMGGVELAEKIAGILPGLKILFMSGYTDDALVQQKILESGISFLQKPFRPMTLAQKVRQALAGEQSQQWE
jgi:two-component system, cell cycle sensor histidine kinase and response regulator CckA